MELEAALGVTRCRECDTVCSIWAGTDPSPTEPVCGRCAPVELRRLTERIAKLEAWARDRIEECRRQEVKFGASTIARKLASGDALVEAYTERRALQAVLRLLDD